MSAPARYSIFHYRTRRGIDVYEEWLESLDRHDADRINQNVFD